jgi:protein-tyrosine phosphatase
MITEILSGLWIGNINDAYNEEFYKDNLITIAINCTNDQTFLDLHNLTKIRIPLTINLDPQTDMKLLKDKMKQIIQYIHQNIEEHNIFIFCYNGLSISPLIIANYMMKYGEISTDNIREILRSKNENICLDFDLSMFI